MAAAKRLCIGVACANPISTLQCPTCLKLGRESFFCSQDCFKTSWVTFSLLSFRLSSAAAPHPHVPTAHLLLNGMYKVKEMAERKIPANTSKV